MERDRITPHNQELLNRLSVDEQDDVLDLATDLAGRVYMRTGVTRLGTNGALEVLAAIGRLLVTRCDAEAAQVLEAARQEGVLSSNGNGKV